MVTIGEDGYAEFRFFRPQVGDVFVTGDFNEWRTDQLRMVHRGDGYWVLRVALPPGDYRFRYVANGFWYTDYAAFGVEPAQFGYNSILRVPERTLRLRPATQPQRQIQPAAAAA